MSMLGDLSSLFGAPPAGSAQDWRYRSGVIRSWNPLTLQNQIDCGGTILTDVPVLGAAEAATYTVGDVVGLAVIGTGHGGATWAVVGRFVIPNTAGASTALSFLSSRTTTASIATSESTGSGAFVDLATIGPTVPVLVGPSGRCLVTFGAHMQTGINVPGGVQTNSAQMSYEARDNSGAVVIAAGVDIAQLFLLTSAVAGLTIDIAGAHSRQVVRSGLTPGSYTFTAKYASGAAVPAAQFSARFMTIQAL